MNTVQSDIEALVNVELAEANKVNPPFCSAHEGYAVILEEIDEANMEVADTEYFIDALWAAVKHNKPEMVKAAAQKRTKPLFVLPVKPCRWPMCNKLLAFMLATDHADQRHAQSAAGLAAGHEPE